MSQPGLHASIRRLRRRLLVIGGAAGLFWAVVAAIVVLVLAVWLDLVWDLSANARAASLGAAAACAAALAGLTLFSTVRRAGAGRLARDLDRAAESGGVILSGWDLLAAGQRAAGRDAAEAEGAALTAALADRAVAAASERAAETPAARAVPARPLRIALAWCLATLLAVTLAVLCLPQLAATEWSRFVRPHDDQPPFSLVRFQVEPGDARVVYGSPFEVHAAVSGAPVERVELVVRDGEEQSATPMFPEADGRWRAVLARVHRPAAYFVRAERARSSQYKLDVITVPKIESVRFRVTPPSYTRNAVYEGPLPREGIAALAGTQVEIWAQSNRPLSGGVVQLSGGSEPRELKMEPVERGGHRVKAELVVQEEGRFQLNVVDEAGQPSQETFGGAITLLADERPHVRLTQPRPMSLATPNTYLPVTLAAEDDYGVTALSLYRSLNDSRPLPMEIPVSPPYPRRLEERLYLPLAAYGLQPGDTIKLFARVLDNDPAGAKGGESQVVSVRIISQEEFDRLVRRRDGLKALQAKYQRARDQLDKLASEIEGLRKKLKEASEEDREQFRRPLEELAKRLAEQRASLQRSARQLLPYDLDTRLSPQLGALAEMLGEMEAAVQDLQSEPGLSAEDADKLLGELLERLGKGRRQFREEVSEPLEHLALVYPLMQDQSRFVKLARQQRDLAERLAAFKDQETIDDPAVRARMGDLQQEQRVLREELDALLRDIEQHAQRLPDEMVFDELRASALKFVDAVRNSGAAEAMAEAETALSQHDGSTAHARASLAADLLEQFLARCEQMEGEGMACLVFQPSLGEGLGDTIGQLLAEMGMGPGGSGYSVQQGTLDNVGLYGQGDADLNPTGSGDDGPRGEGSHAGGPTGESDAAQHAAAHGSAAGGGMGSVPLRYRQRVGQYLQRIAEETGQ